MIYKGTIKTKELEKPGVTHLLQRVKVSLIASTFGDAAKI
jgi:hypothetical protein